MAEGVDYSRARPGVGCLAADGKKFAVRYVGTPGNTKNLTRPEANALRAAGLDIAAYHQTTADFMLGGRDRGVIAADAALSDARLLGMPAGRPIYYALDRDPRGLSGAQWAAIEAFLAGAASRGGRQHVGVYGGYAAIERLVPAHAPWGCQTYAWSDGKVSAKAHLIQYRNGVTLCGGAVDLCRSLKPDFGQWSINQEDDMPLTDADIPVIAKGVTQALDTQARKVFGIVNYERYLEVLLEAARDDGNVDIDEAGLADAVAAKVGAQLDPVVWAKAVAAALPPTLAEQFLAAFAAELND